MLVETCRRFITSYERHQSPRSWMQPPSNRSMWRSLLRRCGSSQAWMVCTPFIFRGYGVLDMFFIFLNTFSHVFCFHFSSRLKNRLGLWLLEDLVDQLAVAGLALGFASPKKVCICSTGRHTNPSPRRRLSEPCWTMGGELSQRLLDSHTLEVKADAAEEEVEEFKKPPLAVNPPCFWIELYKLSELLKRLEDAFAAWRILGSSNHFAARACSTASTSSRSPVRCKSTRLNQFPILQWLRNMKHIFNRQYT